MNGKKEYRAHYLAVRRALPPEHIAAWSRQISTLILKDPLFAKAGVIMGYLAMAGEPNIDEVLKAALKMGKIVFGLNKPSHPRGTFMIPRIKTKSTSNNGANTKTGSERKTSVLPTMV